MIFFILFGIVIRCIAIMLLDTCDDTSNGKTDHWGTGCDYYGKHPEQCGLFDTTEFFAKLMCCECKGTCAETEIINIHRVSSINEYKTHINRHIYIIN